MGAQKLLLTTSFFTILFVWFSAPIQAQTTTQSLKDAFQHAESQFHYKDYDQAVLSLNAIWDDLCSTEYYKEECIKTSLILANIYRNRGEDQLFRDQIDHAFRFLQEFNMEDHPIQSELYVQLSIFERNQANIELGVSHAKKARALAEEFEFIGLPKARVHMAFGLNEDEAGNYEHAIQEYEQVINSVSSLERTIEVINLLAQAHNNIGISYRRLGNIDEAMKHYQTNLSLVQEAFGQNHLELGYVYNSMGSVYYFNGDYGTAGEYFNRAATIFRTNLGDSSSRYAASLNNAGVSFTEMGNLDRALQLFEQAQRIKEQTLGIDHPETAVGYSNLATIYMQNGDSKKALENAKRSIDVRKQTYGDQHPSLALPIARYGDFLTELNRFDEGRFQYRKAISIIEQTIGSQHPDIWYITTKIGTSYAQQDNHQVAVTYFRDAVEMISELSESASVSSIDLSGLSHPLYFLSALKKWGDSERMLYKDTDRQSHLYRANSLYAKASETVDYLQFQYRSEASKLSLIDTNYPIYTRGIETNHDLYIQRDEQQWIDTMIELSEKSRSRIALELLRESEAKEFANIPDSILEQDNSINESITKTYQKLNLEQEKGNDSNPALLEQYRDSLFYLKQNLEEFTSLLEDRFPLYHQIKYNQKLVNRKQAQAMLDHDQSILKYIVDDEFIILMVITKTDVITKKITPTVDLTTTVESLRKAVLEGDHATISKTGYSFYKAIFEPVEEYITTSSLIIIPDRALYYLPFEMLLTEEITNTRYQNFPFLLRDYKISYAPSLTVLDYMKSTSHDSPKNLLAFAPFAQMVHSSEPEVTTDRFGENVLPPLPLTSHETKEIAKLFQTRHSVWDYLSPEQTTILENNEASIRVLHNEPLEEYSYIHFATHAFVDDKNPELSGIAFWGEDEEDEIMYVNDIYSLNLDADLVVLGACETGLGTLHQGEGLIGFTRAFIYAGSSNLAVSMWRVSDQPTSRLMISFYEYIRKGHSYAESLQLAKLDLISYPEFAEPKNWAAFVLHGY